MTIKPASWKHKLFVENGLSMTEISALWAATRGGYPDEKIRYFHLSGVIFVAKNHNINIFELMSMVYPNKK